MKYPNVGDYIRVTGIWKGKPFDWEGTVLPSRKNPETPAYRVRSGAVLATIELDDGRKKTVPWSASITKFEIIHERRV